MTRLAPAAPCNCFAIVGDNVSVFLVVASIEVVEVVDPVAAVTMVAVLLIGTKPPAEVRKSLKATVLLLLAVAVVVTPAIVLLAAAVMSDPPPPIAVPVAFFCI